MPCTSASSKIKSAAKAAEASSNLVKHSLGSEATPYSDKPLSVDAALITLPPEMAHVFINTKPT